MGFVGFGGIDFDSTWLEFVRIYWIVYGICWNVIGVVRFGGGRFCLDLVGIGWVLLEFVGFLFGFIGIL